MPANNWVFNGGMYESSNDRPDADIAASVAGAGRRTRVAFGSSGAHLDRLDAGVTALEDIERRRRALDAEELAVFAELRDVAASEASTIGEHGPVETTMAYRSVQAEVAAALRTGPRTVDSRLQHAHVVSTTYPAVLSAMEAGEISSRHAHIIVDAGSIIGSPGIPDTHEVALRRSAYETKVVAKAATGSPATLKPLAKRVAEQYATTSLDERHRRAKQLRRVQLTNLDDGMALLGVVLPAHHAHAAASRVRGLAKQLHIVENREHGTARTAAESREDGTSRAGTLRGERRTLPQIQADLIAELLLTSPAEIASAPGATVRGIVQVILNSGHLAEPLDRVLDPVTGTAARGIPTPELTGYGPMPVEAAREVAATASTWIEVTADRANGSISRLEPRLPSAAQRRMLLARDETCRWFGCAMPAHHCDIDHTVDYAQGGATEITNLGALCRNHHLLKHHGGWRMQQFPDGEYALTSPTGRIYRTEPTSRVRFAYASDPPDCPESDDGHPAADMSEKLADEGDAQNGAAVDPAIENVEPGATAQDDSETPF